MATGAGLGHAEHLARLVACAVGLRVVFAGVGEAIVGLDLGPRVKQHAIALQAVAALRAGRTEARETGPVRPVSEECVNAILPHVTPQVRAMIELQQLTGMRPNEVTAIRPMDIDRSQATWTSTVRSST